jgi:hypothetical protein
MAQLVLHRNHRATQKEKRSRRRRAMDKKNEDHKDSSMCFDNMNHSELRKLMGKEGIGSLCKEIMGMMVKTEKGEWACARFMEQMMTKQRKTEEKAGNDKEQRVDDSKEDRRRG